MPVGIHQLSETRPGSAWSKSDVEEVLAATVDDEKSSILHRWIEQLGTPSEFVALSMPVTIRS